MRCLKNVSINDPRDDEQLCGSRREFGDRLVIPFRFLECGRGWKLVGGIWCNGFISWRESWPPVKQLIKEAVKFARACWRDLQTDEMLFKKCWSLAIVSDIDFHFHLFAGNKWPYLPALDRNPRSLIQSHLIAGLLNGPFRGLALFFAASAAILVSSSRVRI